MKKNIFKNDKIFIAGSSGMAGSAIKKTLLKNQYGKKQFGGILLTPNRKELNLLDYNSVKNWFEYNQPDVVIVAAAEVGGIIANSSRAADFILNNLKMQTNIIENAWKNKTRRLLFLGSSCIYPRSSPQPIKEDYLLSGYLEPTNQWYAIAKIAGIKLCQALRLQYDFDAISLMPTNLYGPGDNYSLNESHVMASFIRKFYEASKNNYPNVTCWGTGTPLREFMHVKDLGNAVLYALENWDPKSSCAPKDSNGDRLSILNVGTGVDISIKDLAKKIAKATNFKGEILWDLSKPDGTPKKQLDIVNIKELGWSPTIDLDTGIKATLKSFSLEYKS